MFRARPILNSAVEAAFGPRGLPGSNVDCSSVWAQPRHVQEMAGKKCRDLTRLRSATASVSNDGQPVRHVDPRVGIQRVRDCTGVLVVGTTGGSTSCPIFVDVRDGEHQVIDLHHHQCLNEVVVDCVPHPRPSSLDFRTESPRWVVSVDLIAQRGHAVLTGMSLRAVEIQRRLG